MVGRQNFRLCQFRIRQRLGIQHRHERVPKQPWVVAVVELESDFVQVAFKVLGGKLVEGTDDGTLQDAPYALIRVCVNVSPYPFVVGMINHFVPKTMLRQLAIAGVLVGVDGGFIVHVIANERFQNDGTSVPALDVEADRATPRDSAEHHCLVGQSPALIALDTLGGGAVLVLAPDVGFVNLYGAGEQLGIGYVHRGADAVTEIPGCFVRDIERPLQLIGRNALLGLDHHVGGKEPLPERQVGVVEHSSDPDRELVAA